MKQILKIVLLVCVLTLVSGVALAATTPGSTKYTAEQQACIKAAQTERLTATKDATDALNAATKDALKARQTAMTAAQKIKDPVAKTAAIKAANDTYNNNSSVKAARVPYMEAVKAPNQAFQAATKACLTGSTSGKGFNFNSLFNKAGASISNSFSSIINFFLGRK